MALSSRSSSLKRAQRTRTRLRKLANGRPRLSVFRSSKNIYAQVIDDERGVTLAAASSLEGGEAKTKGSDKDAAARVGFGHGKAREVPEAIRKATEEAKKTMIRVPLRESRTLHHDGNGRWGAGKVMVRAAPAGTGVIAGGPMRAVLETLGVQDVVGKSVGSSNPYNMVRATFEALKAQSSPRQVASKRGKKVADVIGRRADGASTVAASDAEG